MEEREKRELIEKAVNFISDKFKNQPRDLTKPVVCHSLRVGFYLYDRGYNTEIILAGFLHDLLEDTETNLEEIMNLFGKKVAELVDANSKRIDANEKTRDMVDRCVITGEDALIVKASDVIENIEYSDKQNWDKGKEHLPKICGIIFEKKPESFDDPIFDELRKRNQEFCNG